MNCVCSHEPVEHHAWTGACNACNCSYFEEDLGTDTTTSGPTWATFTTYRGIYANRDWREPA